MILQPLFSFLKDIPQTFYASGFYQRLMFSDKGIGFSFILMATLLGALHLTFVLLPSMRPLIEDVTALFDVLPEVTLEDGTLTVKGETPQTFTLLKNEPNGPLVLVIDPTIDMANAAALEKKMAEEKIFFIVGKNHFALYNPEQKTIDISAFNTSQNVTMTHEKWVAQGETIKTLLFPLSSLTLVGMLFLFQMFTAFLGALLILIVAPLFKLRPALADSMRLASAAKVPVAVIFLIATPYPPLQVAVWFGFVAFGLLSARKGHPITQG